MKKFDTFVFFILLLSASSTRLFSQTWTKIAGPWEGTIKQLTCDNRNPATVYAGGRSGIYRSTDNGLTWVRVSVSDGSNISESILYQANVFTDREWTNDAGASWRSLALPQGATSSSSLKLDPNSGGIVYLLTSSRLFKSGDFAATWTVCDDSAGSYPYDASDHVQVSRYPATVIFTSGIYGYVRKSTDQGATWKGLRYANNYSYNGTGNWALEIDPSNSQIVYVGRGDTLFKSTDGGVQWTKTALTSAQCQALAIDFSNTNTLYIAYDRGILKSTNAGNSFQQVWNNTTLERITSMVCLANGYLLKATGGQGVLLSTDGGATFRSVGVEQVIPRGMRFINADNTMIGWNSNAVYATADGGGTWRLSLARGSYERNALATDPSSWAHWLFASGSYCYLTSDGGVNWGTAPLAASGSASEIFFAPSNVNILYTARTASRSADGGLHWSLINEPIPGVDASTIRVSPANPDLLLANANSCLAVVRSDDGGQHWYSFQNGITGTLYGTYLSDLAFDPVEPNTAYVSNGSLYKLTLPASNWTKIYDQTANPSSSCSIGKLLIDPGNNLKMYSYQVNCLLVGSSNGGATWGLASGGIPDEYKSVSDAFMGSTGRVYLVTGAGLIWGSPAIVNAVANTRTQGERDFLLGQNFPNPANPETVIPFRIARDGRVTLKLFDILGREVATLLDEQRSAGEHTLRLATSSLSSGVYIYRIVSGGFADSKRLIVLR